MSEKVGHRASIGLNMGHTLTVRLSKELAERLEDTAAKSGVSQGKIVRDQLEQARARRLDQRFMRLAGAVTGVPNLSAKRFFQVMEGIADTSFLVAFAPGGPLSRSTL